MKAFPAMVLVLALLGCGADDQREQRIDQDICRHLAEGMAARMATHEADRPRLEATKTVGYGLDRRDYLALMPTVSDVAATYAVARRLGSRCLSLRDNLPCDPYLVLTPTLLDDLDHAYEQMALLQRSLGGAGSCARKAGEPQAMRGTPACTVIAHALGLSAHESAVTTTLQGWPLRLEPNGATATFTSFAAKQMSEWRAMVDYGLAVAPTCLPPTALASCETLRDGLLDADPAHLAGRVRSLSEAFTKGTACGAPTVAP